MMQRATAKKEQAYVMERDRDLGMESAVGVKMISESLSGEVMVELALKWWEEVDLVSESRRNTYKNPGVGRSLAASSGNRKKAVWLELKEEGRERQKTHEARKN